MDKLEFNQLAIVLSSMHNQCACFSFGTCTYHIASKVEGCRLGGGGGGGGGGVG